MRTKTSFTTALFVTASIAVLSLTLAQRAGAQDVKPPQQTGQTGQKPPGQTDGKTDPKTAKAKVCLTAAQEKELDDLRYRDIELDTEAQQLQHDYDIKREDIASLTNKVNHFTKVLAGKEEMSDQEKKDDLKPAEEKAEAEAELKEAEAEAERMSTEYTSKRIQQAGVKEKIEKLEKIKNGCEEPPAETAEVPNPPGGGNPGNPPPAGKCQNEADAKQLAEYRRLVAFYEKEQREIQDQLKGIDDKVIKVNGQANLNKDIKKIQLGEFNKQRADLNKRYIDAVQAVDKFKGLIKAILEKKPCPEEKKTTGYVPRQPTEIFVSLDEPVTPVITVSLGRDHGHRYHEHRRHERSHKHGRVERPLREHTKIARLSPERSRTGGMHFAGGRGGLGGMRSVGGGMGRMGGMGRR